MTKEMMSMEQLDTVSGGTWKEYFEIANLLPSALLESRNELGETYFAKCYMYPKEVEDWLNKNLGIWANIDAGSSFKSEPQSRRKKFLHAKRRKCDAQQSYHRNSQLPRQMIGGK